MENKHFKQMGKKQEQDVRKVIDEIKEMINEMVRLNCIHDSAKRYYQEKINKTAQMLENCIKLQNTVKSLKEEIKKLENEIYKIQETPTKDMSESEKQELHNKREEISKKRNQLQSMQNEAKKALQGQNEIEETSGIRGVFTSKQPQKEIIGFNEVFVKLEKDRGYIKSQLELYKEMDRIKNALNFLGCHVIDRPGAENGEKIIKDVKNDIPEINDIKSKFLQFQKLELTSEDRIIGLNYDINIVKRDRVAVDIFILEKERMSRTDSWLSRFFVGKDSLEAEYLKRAYGIDSIWLIEQVLTNEEKRLGFIDARKEAKKNIEDTKAWKVTHPEKKTDYNELERLLEEISEKQTIERLSVVRVISNIIKGDNPEKLTLDIDKKEDRKKFRQLLEPFVEEWYTEKGQHDKIVNSAKTNDQRLKKLKESLVGALQECVSTKYIFNPDKRKPLINGNREDSNGIKSKKTSWKEKIRNVIPKGGSNKKEQPNIKNAEFWEIITLYFDIPEDERKKIESEIQNQNFPISYISLPTESEYHNWLKCRVGIITKENEFHTIAQNIGKIEACVKIYRERSQKSREE